jgi:hypothetical protein
VVEAAHERDAMEKAAKEEPDRDVSGGVPDEARGHSSVCDRPDGGNDDGDRRANASRSNHPATSLGSALSDPARRAVFFKNGKKFFQKNPIPEIDFSDFRWKKFQVPGTWLRMPLGIPSRA